jgi:hypothetical protein
MPRVITTMQAMSHPTVVATINVLAEMSQRLQDENKELIAAVLAEREACAQVCDELHPHLATRRAAEIIRARSEVFTRPRSDRT